MKVAKGRREGGKGSSCLRRGFGSHREHPLLLYPPGAVDSTPKIWRGKMRFRGAPAVCTCCLLPFLFWVQESFRRKAAVVWSNLTEPLETGRLPGRGFLSEPTQAGVLPSHSRAAWGCDTGVVEAWGAPPGEATPCPAKGFAACHPMAVNLLLVAGLWHDSQHLIPAASHRLVCTVVQLSAEQ